MTKTVEEGANQVASIPAKLYIHRSSVANKLLKLFERMMSQGYSVNPVRNCCYTTDLFC